MKQLCVIVLGLAVVLGAAARADDASERPNFTGRWRMIKAQSNFGKFKQPDIIVRVVDEHFPTLNIHTVQTTGKDTTTSDVSYFIDGRESTNVLNGHDATSNTFWDGSALMVRTETKNSRNENTQFLDRWELSTDGEVLTISSHVETTKGEADLKLVCQKEKTPE